MNDEHYIQQWIDDVLTHHTNDYINNQSLVNALVGMVTTFGRSNVALVIKSYIDSKPAVFKCSCETVNVRTVMDGVCSYCGLPI